MQIKSIARWLRRQFKPARPALGPIPGPGDFPAFVRHMGASLHGWCSEEKATRLFDLVRAERPTVLVEVGVFGGRSLLPMAYACRENGHGRVTGIDAWDAIAATEYATEEVNDRWWTDIDYTAVKASYLRYMLDAGLAAQVRSIEADARRVASAFDCIDLLHIDGAHSLMAAATDVVNYVPRVRPGGIVVFDDVDWDTTRPAVDMLHNSCDVIDELREHDAETVSCLFLRKRG